VIRKLPLPLLVLSIIALAPRSQAGTVPCQAFSLSINNYYNPWPSASFCSKRLWDTGAVWKNINPSYGQYNWSWLDKLMLQAAQHGADTVFTFGVVPAWASTDPGLTGCGYGNGACAPPVLSDWRAFVDALSRHSAANRAAGKGSIGAYELWNEPNASNWWRGTPQQMVTLAQAAYTIIKQNDPHATVISPTAQGIYGWRWTQSFFAAGGHYVDVVGMHGYLPRGTSQPENYLTFLLNNTHAVMSAYGLASSPIWDMEANWTADSNLPSLSQQAAFLSRSYILRLFSNVQRFYWYSWDNVSNGTLWTSTGGLRPAGVAWGQVAGWLVGATLGSCANNGGIWTCNISRSNGYLGLLVWDQSGTATYKAPSAYQHYRDIAGGVHRVSGAITIGQQPFLLENN
jgi:hypothetical protein